MGDSLGFGVVFEEMFHFLVEVRKIAFDLDDVLIGTVGDEEVGVWFYPVGIVDDGDGGAV